MVNFQAKGAGQPWGVSVSEDGTTRVEVRDGDFPNDANGVPITVREQAYAVFADQYALGQPVEVGFKLTVDDGLRNTSPYLIFAGLGINAADGSSPGSLFTLNMVGERLTAFINSIDSNGASVSTKIYSDLEDLHRGVAYDIDVKTTADASGNGRVVLTINGQIVADYTGPLGIAGQQSVSVFEGIQRGGVATETMSATFSPVTVTQGDAVVLPEITPFIREPTLMQGEITYADDQSGDFFSDITGWSQPNSTVDIFVDGVLFGSVEARAGDGFFQLNDVRLPGLGIHNISAIALDGTGARSITSYPLVIPIGTPEDYAASRGGFFVVFTGGQTYLPQGANKPWSVTTIGENDLRFELRDGERHEWDVSNWHTSERSELAGWQHVFANDVPIQISYGFLLEPGAPNTAQWVVLGQLHQDLLTPGKGASPPFDIGLDGERMVIDVRYGSSFSPQTARLFLDASDIVRGHLYDIKVAVVFDPAGNGHLTVERDGITLVDYTGPLGYVEQNGVYWSEGIYRAGNATETMAAQYHDLEIKTGDGVTFAPEGSFVSAPVLNVESATISPDGASMVLHITGTALAGSTVSILKDGVLFTTALADADGTFVVDLTTSSSASQGFAAYATTEAGRQGLSSVPAVILQTSAADLVAKLGTLSGIAGLEAIVLTDSHVLQLTAPLQLAYAFKKDAGALSTVLGEFSLVYAEVFTGRAYDRQVTTYAPDGKTTLVERFASGRLTYEDVFAKDGTHVLSTFDASGSETRTHYNAANQRVTSESFNAQHQLVSLLEIASTGAQTTHYYTPATGVETRMLVVMPDKTKVDTLINIQGKGYVSQVSHFDASNKLIAQERIAASGFTVLAQTWSADGSKAVHNFSAQTGLETSSTLTAADGSRVVTQFGITDKPYAAEALRYDAANRPSGFEHFDANGIRIASEIWNADGSRQVLALDANGQATGYTLTAADSSYVKVVFVAAGTTNVAESTSYTGDGHVTEHKVFDVNFKLQTVETWSSDGSHKLVSYAESGIIRETRYDASDAVTAKILYNLAGVQLNVTNFLADGSRSVHAFDPLTGLELVSRTFHLDGTRTEVAYQLKTAGYTSQAITYNAAGQPVETQRWMGDKLVLSTTKGTDGSETIMAWTALGRETIMRKMVDGSAQTQSFDANGHLILSSITRVDGSRETHNFDPLTGAEKNYTIVDALGVKEIATLGIIGKAYASQHSFFDKAGQLTDLVRHFDGPSGQIAQQSHFGSDGSSEITAFSVSGQMTSRVATAADGSRSAATFSYADATTHVASQIRDEHWNASGQRTWIDVTSATGSHAINGFAKGLTIASHEGVSDIFALAGGDHFVFTANSGNDKIVGFHADAGPLHDTIEISSQIATQFSDLHISQVGQDVVIALSDHDTITLTKTSIASITPDDFHFF